MQWLLRVLLILTLTVGTWWILGGGSHADISELRQRSSVKLGPVSKQHIAQSDLPPEGTRSLFDHLLAQNDGLPFPFENLLALIQAQAPGEDAPLALMIPLGRSLLKASADFALPRVVFAADYHAANTSSSIGIAPRGQLFLGFTEGANEIEVISYNELAGRFEFQLVQNYCEGCAPRIVYARRDICLTCHQGGAPIFSVRPWQETNAQPEISGKIVEARGPEPYLGAAPVQALSTAERIDELTDVGNFITVMQRIWLDGCGEAGNDCRRRMLKLALAFLDDPASVGNDHSDVKVLRRLQAMHWPEEGIPIPNNDLHNRDPLKEAPSLRQKIGGMFSLRSDPPAAARDNEDLDAFNKLPKLPAPLDPLTPRPVKRVLTANDLDGVYGLAQFFTDSDRDTLFAASGNNWQMMIDRIERLPAEAFSAKPFSRVQIMQALVGAAGTDDPAAGLSYCCLDTAEMSVATAATAPPLEIASGSVLEPFERHCFACHRGNPAKRLNFMGGDNEEMVLAAIEQTTAIRDALDWKRYINTEKASTLMPPADSAQREALEAELAQNPELLTQMRDVIPAMFDF